MRRSSRRSADAGNGATSRRSAAAVASELNEPVEMPSALEIRTAAMGGQRTFG
jgi:hypothetical protein